MWLHICSRYVLRCPLLPIMELTFSHSCLNVLRPLPCRSSPLCLALTRWRKQVVKLSGFGFASLASWSCEGTRTRLRPCLVFHALTTCGHLSPNGPLGRASHWKADQTLPGHTRMKRNPRLSRSQKKAVCGVIFVVCGSATENLKPSQKKKRQCFAFVKNREQLMRVKSGVRFQNTLGLLCAQH